MTERRGINLSGVRDHNTALILSALRSAGSQGSSQARLAEVTGLTPQAISKIVSRLAGDGLVVRTGQGVSPRGKPPTILSLSALARWVIGAYLDREQTTFALIGLSGAEISRVTVPVGMSASSSEVLSMFDEQIPALLRQAPAGLSPEPQDGMLGVGVACPGPLDQETGILGGVTGLPHWHGFPLRAALSARMAAPVTLTKDTDAAAHAIHDSGASGNHAYVHLGTGLGAGLILGGHVYHARHVRAGEFGHQTIDIDGPQCACGRRGCLEAACLQALAQGRPGLAAGHLAAGLVSLDRLLGLDQITLGGRIIEEFPGIFRDRARDALAEAAGSEAPPQVRVALGDEQLIVHGAAARVLDAFFRAAN